MNMLMSRDCGRIWGGWAITLCAAIVSGACASSGAVPHPFPMPTRGAPAAPPPPSVPDPPAGEPRAREAPLPEPSLLERPSAAPSRVETLVEAALALRGVPYRNGGSAPDGFDCSGFTQYVFGQVGIALPRDTRNQYSEGRSVEAEDLAPGDLVFFSTVARGPSHVAIAIDRDRFVHAPSSTGVVRVERLSSSYWSRRYIGARRVTDSNRQ
jgi:cell wall-associated NlpC family hydrolase